ncbi:AMP-binding protein, partial [Bacillus thuringiensis]|nr:AMP-binding protein [Bacillus thuringiensis]
MDEASGALSVGVPVFSTVVRIARDDGSDADGGEVGEIVTRGPQVVPGYARHWETDEALDPEVIETLRDAQGFGQGFETLEY